MQAPATPVTSIFGQKHQYSNIEPPTPETPAHIRTGDLARLECVAKRPEVRAQEFDHLLNVSNTPYGSGTFSNVYSAKSSDELFAVKRLKKGSLLDTWANEVRALSILNSPGHGQVIHFYGTWGDNGLVVDFYEVDLYKAISKINNPEVFEPLIGTERWISWAEQLASGLRYIHSKDIIHGDLKPNNMLLNFKNGEPTVPVIADFSSAIIDKESAQVTSPIYSAPEVQNGGEPTTSSDIYALGVVLLYCAAGQEAYADAKNAYQRVMWQKSVSPYDSYDDEASLRVMAIKSVAAKLIDDRTLDL